MGCGGVWSVECGVGNGEWEVGIGVWGLEIEEWGGKWGVGSGNMESYVRNEN